MPPIKPTYTCSWSIFSVLLFTIFVPSTQIDPGKSAQMSSLSRELVSPGVERYQAYGVFEVATQSFLYWSPRGTLRDGCITYCHIAFGNARCSHLGFDFVITCQRYSSSSTLVHRRVMFFRRCLISLGRFHQITVRSSSPGYIRYFPCLVAGLSIVCIIGNCWILARETRLLYYYTGWLASSSLLAAAATPFLPPLVALCVCRFLRIRHILRALRQRNPLNVYCTYDEQGSPRI